MATISIVNRLLGYNMNISTTDTLIFIALTVLFYYWRKESRSYKFLKSVPGRPILPIIGQFLHVPSPHNLIQMAEDHHKMYGNRMSLTCGPFQLVWFAHPDDVAKILSSRDRTTDKFWLYPLVFTEWLGNCLFNMTGKGYFVRRKMIMPAFNFGILEHFYTIFNRNAENLVNVLEPKATQGEAVEIRTLVNLCALDIIFESATGTRVNCLAQPDHEYPNAHIKEFKYLYVRAFSPWLWPSFLWKLSPTGRKEKQTRATLCNFIDKIVRDRKAELLAKTKPSGLDVNGNELPDIGLEESNEKKNVLDLLIHEQQRGELKITDKDIRDETSFFIFAGHDTTSSTLTWALYLLAKNPEEQAKLQLEVDEVCGDDPTRNIEGSDLPRLKYLECCIKETLRLYPPAPFFGRKIERDLQLADKTIVPEGTQALIFPWLTHRLPEFFPEPEKFIPTRFTPENSVGRHPYAYIAFSGGPRNCMGQKYALAETKIILAHIFRKFNVELTDPNEKVVPLVEGTVTPLKGLRVTFKPR